MAFQYAIALTGGIATGKSTVASLLSLNGLRIIDADKISHQILDDNKEWVEEKFSALNQPATKTNYYSEDEINALKGACKGLGVLPKGAIKEVCDQLIEDGWNDTYGQTRTSSALRTKYLRLIGEK